jgi:glyoxylase-like metal-dependent hydrolase (beta-lactamase superfamily II)
MLIKPYPKTRNTHAVAIPLPGFSDLITANLYVLGKSPVTLIDTGPKFPGSFDFVTEEIKDAGFDIRDVERVIITHGHLDHFGLAVKIREAARGPVEFFLHGEDKWRISSEAFEEDAWSKETGDFMNMVDMPQKEIEKIRNRFSFFKRLCDPLDDVSTMEEGDEFVGDGYCLRVIHTPGHSPGSSCLYESQEKILFSGDHIIKHITPNPLVEIKRHHLRDPNYQSLRAYMNSLDKLNGLDVRLVFPGHGEYIEDLQGITATYREHHQQRMDQVWEALKRKPRPLYHLIDDVFDHVPEYDVFLAISEILVHLEILINEGRAKLLDPGPPAFYGAL